MPETLVNEEQLLELLEAVLGSMLGQAVSAAAEAADLPAAELTASVQISGVWNGAVLLGVSETFARRAAESMFDLTPAEVAPADVDDVLAELCNIISGGIKGLLPGVNTLSLPSVTRGSDYAIHIPHARRVAQGAFACQAEPLTICLLEGRRRTMSIELATTNEESPS